MLRFSPNIVSLYDPRTIYSMITDVEAFLSGRPRASRSREFIPKDLGARMILLFTDFGPGGPYLGQMKAVLAEIAPAVPVIDLMSSQEDVEDKGGTMRLGLYAAKLAEGSKVRELYGEELVYERHRHRWEVNNRYRKDLESAGMRLSGLSPDDNLVEYVELVDHPFFVATQAHPELKSRPDNPHPLFAGLIEAASRKRANRPVIDIRSSEELSVD